jgi:hypothetical protein
MAALDDLLDSIFDRQKPSFSGEFEGWVRESRRFREFAGEYRTKIRAKLRQARDEASLEDLRAELAAAELLLRDRRFDLEYEKYAALKQRGPDFTVTFKTHTPFNVEVRRLRAVEQGDGDDGSAMGKLMTVLCDKVGQMPPSIANLLWLAGGNPLGEDELERATAALRQMAERKEEPYFTRRGFKSAADFLKQFSRLSGIVLRRPGDNVLWLNPLARHRLPADIVTALLRLDGE